MVSKQHIYHAAETVLHQWLPQLLAPQGQNSVCDNQTLGPLSYFIFTISQHRPASFWLSPECVISTSATWFSLPSVPNTRCIHAPSIFHLVHLSWCFPIPWAWTAFSLIWTSSVSCTNEEVWRKASWVPIPWTVETRGECVSVCWGGWGGVKHPRLAVKAAVLSEGLALKTRPHFPMCRCVHRPSLDAWHRVGPQ